MNKLHRLKLSQLQIPDFDAALMSDAARRYSLDTKSLTRIRPVVWKCGEQYRLLTSKEPVAALVSLGLAEDDILVRLYEGDVRGAEIIANYKPEREPETQNQLISELFDVTLRSLPEIHRTAKPGRPRSARGEALNIVAQMLGIGRRAVEYAIKKSSGTSNVHTFGIELDPALATRIEHARQWYLQSAQKLTSIYSTRNQDAFDFAPKPELERLLSGARALAEAVRSATPTAICPYCKRVDGLMQECTACGGIGLASKASMDAVPEKLLDTAKPFVMHNGKLVPLEVAQDGDLW